MRGLRARWRQSGDWVTPRLYGQPWFEKPVLYYWAAALGFSAALAGRMGGATAFRRSRRWWQRLRSVGLVGNITARSRWTVRVAFISCAADFFDERCRNWFRARGRPGYVVQRIAYARDGKRRDCADRDAAPCVLKMTHQANTEPSDLFCAGPFRRVARTCSARERPGGSCSRRRARSEFGLLATEPVARRAPPRSSNRDLRVLRGRACRGTSLCAARNPDFIHIFIFQHNFERYLTPMFQHRQPFWYFVPILDSRTASVDSVPLVQRLQEGLQLWREKSWRNSPGFFFACWAVFPFLFFSFSQSKLPGYILPAIPPLALLIAVGLQRRIRRLNRSLHSLLRRRSWSLIAVGDHWIVMALSAVHWTNRLPAAARDVAGRMILHASIARGRGRDRDRRASLYSESVAHCCFHSLWSRFWSNCAGARVLPALDPYHLGKISRRPASQRSLPESRLHVSSARVPGNTDLNFYLEREVQEWSPDDAGRSSGAHHTRKASKKSEKVGRLQGTLDEPYQGILYVPVLPAAALRASCAKSAANSAGRNSRSDFRSCGGRRRSSRNNSSGRACSCFGSGARVKILQRFSEQAADDHRTQ